jgi:hypothetical protein
MPQVSLLALLHRRVEVLAAIPIDVQCLLVEIHSERVLPEVRAAIERIGAFVQSKM